jgi:putative FmdB family regulatory protein
MPRYEYQCTGCAGVIERSRTIAERHDPGTACPECGGLLLLTPSISGFVLRGGGWTPKGAAGTPPPPRTAKRSKGYDMTGSSRED